MLRDDVQACVHYLGSRGPKGVADIVGVNVRTVIKYLMEDDSYSDQWRRAADRAESLAATMTASEIAECIGWSIPIVRRMLSERGVKPFSKYAKNPKDRIVIIPARPADTTVNRILMTRW